MTTDTGAVFGLAELTARLRSSDQPYLEYLRMPSLSAGIYHLEPDQPDRQHPHTEDELYYVIDGEGAIEIAGNRSAVRAGDTIFVAKHVEHRFHDYLRGITLLVVFAPPQDDASA